MKKYIYETAGTCCKVMTVTLDKEEMKEIEFLGGCPGNLTALKTIMEGKSYKEFLGLFKNNLCGKRPTSCMMEFDKFLTLVDEDVRGISEYPFEVAEV